jgi:hypothetical protein
MLLLYIYPNHEFCQKQNCLLRVTNAIPYQASPSNEWNNKSYAPDSTFICAQNIGSILSPDGNGISQIRHSLQLLRELNGKLRASCLLSYTKWLAVETVIDPAIMYPMVNTYFSESEFKPIESLLCQLKYSALGLNRNFPRAILYGSMCLGGLGIPSLNHKNTTNRINYFLFNIRQNTFTGHKYHFSIIYTQLEIGIFNNFFSSPFHTYGHLATHSMATQICKETEQYIFILRSFQLGLPAH